MRALEVNESCSVRVAAVVMGEAVARKSAPRQLSFPTCLLESFGDDLIDRRHDILDTAIRELGREGKAHRLASDARRVRVVLGLPLEALVVEGVLCEAKIVHANANVHIRHGLKQGISGWHGPVVVYQDGIPVVGVTRVWLRV
jgi:hypothetical protein